jgi:hypothetical protein
VLAGWSSVRPKHRLPGGGYSIPDLKCLGGFAVDCFLEITDDEAAVRARRHDLWS